MKDNNGKYLLVVDGSIPIRDGGVYSTIAGIPTCDMLKEAARARPRSSRSAPAPPSAASRNANPNPTGAVSVSDIVKDKPIINISGCPPIPVVMTGVLAHYLTFGKLPELDDLGRPKAFFGDTIHDRCYRRPFYDQGMFAKSFDDEGARKGWCLYELGCKGPITYNACATMKWNGGTSLPDPVRPRLPRLFRAEFLGRRRLLQGAVDAGRPGQVHRGRGVGRRGVGVAVSFANRAKKARRQGRASDGYPGRPEEVT